MENSIAVITVPFQEWTETKNLIKGLCEKVSKLTDKEENELLTPQEVMKILKIGRSTFDRYIADGTLIPVKVNQKKYTKRYIKRSDIESYIKNNA